MCGDYTMRSFKFWCQKVLPLVYDDSLSYYEVLCKIVDYINDLIENDKIIGNELTDIKEDLKVVEKWIADFDTTFIEKEVQKYLAKTVKTITFGISSGGYFMAVIPDWLSKLEFGTIQDGDLYGHLTLSYD